LDYWTYMGTCFDDKNHWTALGQNNLSNINV